ERQIIELIATDRIHIPISSMEGKLKRQKPKIAKEIDLSEYKNKFVGERVYARIETDDTTQKARTISEAVNEFAEKYSRYGKILKGMIEEKRQAKESNLYFGINSGCRLTTDDYLGVLTNLGFSDVRARGLYEDLIAISRNLSKKRDEERSILIG
ncbi:MAG: hypothetical protein Q8N63_08545, partial [Nanoarchaeota archaeon]|nr:hypothetical protein [Nanoarchaeota archaeon]